jgi:hypothetical protein
MFVYVGRGHFSAVFYGPSCNICFLGGRDDNGDGSAASVGRGAMRGRREINVDVVRTRPTTLISKQGELVSVDTL